MIFRIDSVCLRILAAPPLAEPIVKAPGCLPGRHCILPRETARRCFLPRVARPESNPTVWRHKSPVALLLRFSKGKLRAGNWLRKLERWTRTSCE